MFVIPNSSASVLLGFRDRDRHFLFLHVQSSPNPAHQALFLLLHMLLYFCTFESFFIPKLGEYHSYKIDIVPKMEYNVLESEVYSLCI